MDPEQTKERIWYAHSIAGMPPETWQTLEAHLCAVAERAEQFATAFGAGEWGFLAGFWHDVSAKGCCKRAGSRQGTREGA